MKNKQDERRSGYSRRQVLGGSTALAAASVLGSQAKAMPRAFFGPKGGSGRDVYVQIFLRGAMDGLTTLVPHGDGDLYVNRPTLAVPPPGQPGGAIDLDGFFGLAPAAAPLLTPYNNGHLAFVHACGSTDPTRSHFDAFARMEFGDPNLPAGQVKNGWIARYLNQATELGLLRGVANGDISPLSFAGAPRSLPVGDMANFSFPGDPGTAQARTNRMVTMYDDEPLPVGEGALNTFASINLLSQIDFAGYVPTAPAMYPNSILGTQMRNTAALIKAGQGVEVITLDVGGWDLHANLGPASGAMASLLDDLTRSLEAFYLDMLPQIGDVVVVVQSEFGRRVEENASAGVDHGHGNVMAAMGGGINGGQILGTWPGLAPAQLDLGDLAITTDYRDIMGEILSVRCGVTDLSAIFPSHTFTTHGITV
jgi:uncharacterized protein (DUF1501 family)